MQELSRSRTPGAVWTDGGRPSGKPKSAGPHLRVRESTSMLRRVVGVLVIGTVGALAAPMPSALGWANGVSGCNSYGGHDWVLDKAIDAAGNDASWVQRRVALRATDDPDCEGGHRPCFEPVVARLRPLGRRVGRSRRGNRGVVPPHEASPRGRP